MYLYRCNKEQRRHGDCDIVLYQSVYKTIVEQLASDTTRENGGLLLGYEEPSAHLETPKIYIVNALPATNAPGTVTSLTFTAETWIEFDRVITSEIRDSRIRRLGWYHSHLNLSIFLSIHDLDVCSVFRRPAHVALVVDPIRNEGGFFVRGQDGYQPDSPQGFWEYQDVAKESVVTWKNMIEVLNPTLPRAINEADISDSDPSNIGYVKGRSTSLIQLHGNPIKVIFSYSHRDELLRDELAKHLSLLKWQGTITEWHDRRITAGQEWAGDIDAHLESAQLILLLISADFLASAYCYSTEMTRAMERHEQGEARVIPIILRDVDWEDAPFAKLQALPKDAKAITSWHNTDEAFADVARGIRRAIKEQMNRS
jgi:proteasome lid subunit RPN8/RPN11